MAEQGVGGLSIGEIARRMGIRPPSLYVYFPSKHALYDALFARGARLLLEAMEAVISALPTEPATLEEVLLPAAQGYVRWSVEHAAYSQLLFWRPVPGFAPSPGAYEPAVRLVQLGVDLTAALQDAGLVRADVPAGQVARDWIIVVSGVASQQLSNAPHENFDDGRFTAAIPELVAMFAGHYSPRTSPAKGRRRGEKR